MTDLSGPLFQTGPSAGYQPGGDAGIKRVGDGGKPKAEKRTTRKDVEALLAQFQPAPAPVKSKAQKEREKLLETLDNGTRTYSDLLVKLRILDGDLGKAEAALKALSSVSRSAAAAISAIPDAKLDPPAEKPKAAKPVTKIEEPASALSRASSPETFGEPEASEVDGEYGGARGGHLVKGPAVDEDSAF